ncbi:hypothetical protein Q0M30_19305, partial [Staphylococcus aureus]|nr:hypothetical protein [Staphylococcus aureus]
MDGKLIWQAGNQLSSPLMVERGVVYATGLSREVRAFDAANGRKLWAAALTGVPEQANAGWANALSL